MSPEQVPLSALRLHTEPSTSSWYPDVVEVADVVVESRINETVSTVLEVVVEAGLIGGDMGNIDEADSITSLQKS